MYGAGFSLCANKWDLQVYNTQKIKQQKILLYFVNFNKIMIFLF